MRKTSLKLLLVMVIVLLTLNSCEKFGVMPTSKTYWIVTKIEINKENTAFFYVTPTYHGDLSVSNTWFCDSVNAFEVGDTLSFAKHTMVETK
jgi:hypothetical protein